MAKKTANYSKFIFAFFAALIVALVFNVLYISITGHHLMSQSDIREYANNRGGNQKIETLYAPRGTIYSSDGEVLAADAKKYKIYAILSDKRVHGNGKPAYVYDVNDTAKKLAPILDMDVDDLIRILSKDQYQVEFGSKGNNLSSVTKDQIMALNLPGIEFEELLSRNYRYGDFASYVIGYALAETQIVNDKSTTHILGKMGIEKLYNKELSGVDGKRVYLADNNNYTLPNGLISETESIPGNNIHLTIDTEIQAELNKLLENLVDIKKADKATCAIMEAKTGRILAVSNYPSFDPNIRDLTNYVDLFLNEPVEPGSVFKTFVYANAIQDGVINLDELYPSGKFYYNEKLRPIKDHNDGEGWGNISYRQGFYYSSNTAICHMLTKYTDKKSLLADYDDLGFFKHVGSDGLVATAGVAGYKNNDGRIVEYLTTGFGQGSTTTAYHLLRAYSAFANDGKMVEPYFIDKITDGVTGEVISEGTTKYSEQIYSADTVKEVRSLLDGVVNIEGNTGYYYHMDDVRLIAKTGTGQIAENGRYKSGYYTNSFVGLAPYDDPEIVIVLWSQNKGYTNRGATELIQGITRAALNKLNEQPLKEVEVSTVVLDNYMNQSKTHVNEVLKTNQLTPIFVGDGDIVISQFPNSKTEVSSQSRVFLQTDGKKIKMPSMEGWSRKEAEAFASMANITLEFDGVGTITSQSISKGTVLKANQKVKVKAK